MGFGARPALGSDLLHRCCLALCAALMLGLGATELRAQTSPATKPHASATKRPIPVTRRQALPAPPSTATKRQTPQAAESVRPKKLARSKRPIRAARKRARAGEGEDRPAADNGALDNRVLANLTERINNNTVSIIAGELDSTDLAIAHEFSIALDDGDNLRILPVVGAGGDRNIRDVRFMKGVDLAITQSNLLARMRQSGDIGPIDDKIVYITKLFNEEMHLVARAESGVTSIEQLAGRKVNLGEAGSGTQSIARDVFDRLRIAVREVNMTERAAIEGLRTGEIDATIVIGGKPVPAVARMAAGFRLLPMPFAKQLRDDFLPATLSSEDYPGLVDPGRRVETLAVGTVLIAYNWPKDSDHYKKIEKFVAAFFPQLAKLQAPPHHPKWRELNIAATLPGWTRFAGAEDWLRQNREPSEAAREQFDRFVSTRQAGGGAPEERERLFREFLQWQQTQERR